MNASQKTGFIGGQNQAGIHQEQTGKKLFLNRRNMFFNRNAARKALQQAQKQKQIALKKQEKAIDDTRWAVKNKPSDLALIRSKINQLSAYDLLYEPFELISSFRRKIQILLVSKIIIDIKNEYNKEFDKLTQLKIQFIETINEKNNRIAELQRQLKQEVEIFAPKSDKDEQPGHILELQKGDITIQKHYSKEQLAKIEQERKKQQQRIKALSADSVGLRGINVMMGGTLKMRKQIDFLEETLVREQWMNKPEDQMNQQERLAFKLFLEKEKELNERKQKQRKAWQMEIRKNRNDINDI